MEMTEDHIQRMREKVPVKPEEPCVHTSEQQGDRCSFIFPIRAHHGAVISATFRLRFALFNVKQLPNDREATNPKE